MTRVLPYQLDHPECRPLQPPAEPKLPEPVEADLDAGPEDAETAWDEADRLAAMRPEDFLAELRGAVEQVQAGRYPPARKTRTRCRRNAPGHHGARDAIGTGERFRPCVASP
jgi:hypothetical protein